MVKKHGKIKIKYLILPYQLDRQPVAHFAQHIYYCRPIYI